MPLWRSRSGERRLDKTYVRLRRQALDVTPDLAGLSVDQQLLGLVMDIGYPEAVASLVGLADGTTSLYFSSGGGAIGGGGHEAVARVTRRWVSIGEELVTHMTPVDTVGLPDGDATQLVAITRDGWRTCEEAPEVFGSGEHVLSPLFFAGHDVVTAFRAVPGSGLA